MKALYSLSSKRLVGAVALGFCCIPAILAAAEPRVIRSAPTNDQVVLQIHQAQLAHSKRPVEETALSQDAAKMSKPVNLFDQMTVLTYGGLSTLVPKGSILETSEKYSNRFEKSPDAKLVYFPEFVAANRGWISTHEVSFEQARGRSEIDDDAKTLMKKSGNVVIATLRGNPIQIMPPPPVQDASAAPQSQTPNP